MPDFEKVRTRRAHINAVARTRTTLFIVAAFSLFSGAMITYSSMANQYYWIKLIGGLLPGILVLWAAVWSYWHAANAFALGMLALGLICLLNLISGNYLGGLIFFSVMVITAGGFQAARKGVEELEPEVEREDILDVGM